MNRYQVHKRSGSKPFKIVKKLSDGSQRTLGSSTSRKRAKISAGIAETRGE